MQEYAKQEANLVRNSTWNNSTVYQNNQHYPTVIQQRNNEQYVDELIPETLNSLNNSEICHIPSSTIHHQGHPDTALSSGSNNNFDRSKSCTIHTTFCYK